MLENGDRIDVGQSGAWDVDVNVSQSGYGAWDVKPVYVSLPGKKPYLINMSRVECIVGEWNKDKTQYGVRIFYASGNSVWIGEEATKALFKVTKCGNEAEIFNRAKREG